MALASAPQHGVAGGAEGVGWSNVESADPPNGGHGIIGNNCVVHPRICAMCLEEAKLRHAMMPPSHHYHSACDLMLLLQDPSGRIRTSVKRASLHVLSGKSTVMKRYTGDLSHRTQTLALMNPFAASCIGFGI